LPESSSGGGRRTLPQPTGGTRAPAVELEGISKRFGSTRALADVSLTIEAGEIHALVGENGAGKSTLGKIIGGIYVPDEGRLTVAGVARRSSCACTKRSNCMRR